MDGLIVKDNSYAHQVINVGSNINTVALLKSALANVTFVSGYNVIEFVASGTPCCTVIMSAASNNYGVGIVMAYYISSSKIYHIKNSNRTFTVYEVSSSEVT